ncbi:MAG: hypothetical protein ACYCUT_09250 [bacterium]
MQKQKFRILTAVLFVSVCLSGCAPYVKTVSLPAGKTAVQPYKSRNEVLAGLDKNYGRFKGLSGRLEISARGSRFSFEQAGLYKYAAGKYMQFTILDMYGDELFYIKIFKNENRAVFFDPKYRRLKYIDIDKKYKGKKLMYQRLFSVFKIFLNMNSLEKIKKAGIFYNTSKGFFFGYRPISDKTADAYYICVGKNYLIRKISAVANKKITETVRFKDYILKGGSMVPLKIYVDDYLYNVKIKVALSKGSKIIQ